MSKELKALEKLRQNFKDGSHLFDNDLLDIIEKALKEYEMEYTLRIRLENANYELVREKQENDKKLKTLEIIKKELMLEVKEDNGLYRLITYQSDNHLIRKDQYELLKEVLL